MSRDCSIFVVLDRMVRTKFQQIDLDCLWKGTCGKGVEINEML